MLKTLQRYIALIALAMLHACGGQDIIVVDNDKLDYKKIVETVKQDTSADTPDSANVFDDDSFDPADGLPLDSLAKMYGRDSTMIGRLGIRDSATLKFNLDQLRSDSLKTALDTNTCRQIDCSVWARVNKSEQMLYLYVNGALVDTFRVSTGLKKYETPTMDRRPSGPIFQKYTSRKFPGGNYMGLGNMPYVVFVRGGYALHGTTKGNIPKLGKKASHGCVRMHPDNAKIFNELVRTAGLQNTWVTIEE